MIASKAAVTRSTTVGVGERAPDRDDAGTVGQGPHQLGRDRLLVLRRAPPRAGARRRRRARCRRRRWPAGSPTASVVCPTILTNSSRSQSAVRSLAASRMRAAGEVVTRFLRCQVLGLLGWGSGLPVTLGRERGAQRIANASRTPHGRSSHRTGTTSPPGQRHRHPGRAQPCDRRPGAARTRRRPGGHRGPGRAGDRRPRPPALADAPVGPHVPGRPGDADAGPVRLGRPDRTRARAAGPAAGGLPRALPAQSSTPTPTGRSESLAAIARRGSDGVILKAPDDPRVAEAVDALASTGIPVVTFVTDLPFSRRVAYVGLDNRSAGATAAYLVSQWSAATGAGSWSPSAAPRSAGRRNARSVSARRCATWHPAGPSTR